jgi:AraC-like DNA-binding protein
MNFYQQQVLAIGRAVYPHADLGEKVIRAKEYIDNHYGCVIDLSAMAREACMSKFHFIRLFRRYYGRTPHIYLREVRLMHARRLLGAGVPIKNVCYAVGFESVPSFTRLYKSVVGVTPKVSRIAILDKKVPSGPPIFMKKIL